MNAATLARSAYTRTTRLAPSARDTEYRLFAQVTKDLSSYSANNPQEFARLAEALNLNNQLWTRLAADVAEPGNGLPEELRGRIFYLAEFTRVQTVRILRKEAETSILVELNTSIMRGLKGEREPER